MINSREKYKTYNHRIEKRIDVPGIKIKGLFKSKRASKLGEDLNIAPGWFVISHRWLSEKKDRRVNHGNLFKITNMENNKNVYRLLRFSPNLKGDKGSSTGEIIIDWQAWLKLCDYAENVPGEMDLSIEKVGKWPSFSLMIFAHPDPIYKLAGALALLSVILGALSFGLAILSII